MVLVDVRLPWQLVDAFLAHLAPAAGAAVLRFANTFKLTTKSSNHKKLHLIYVSMDELQMSISHPANAGSQSLVSPAIHNMADRSPEASVLYSARPAIRPLFSSR